jgi:hypothetical protein
MFRLKDHNVKAAAMDKSIKTILEALNNQIDSNELTTALKADKFEGEYALSEDGITAIVDQTKGLLSAESAINNAEIIEKISKDLYPKHMKSALMKVEENLKPVLDKLGIDYSKHDFVSDAIKDITPKLVELTAGDNQELIDSLNEDLRAAKEGLTKAEEDFQAQLKKRDDDILQDRIKGSFISKAIEKPWADAYSIPEVKEAILDKLWGKINAKAHLKLTDNGEIVPMQKEFPDKELFDGNKVATFQSILEPELDAFLKKSVPETPPAGGKPGETKSEAEQAAIREYERRAARG